MTFLIACVGEGGGGGGGGQRGGVLNKCNCTHRKQVSDCQLTPTAVINAAGDVMNLP